MNKEDKAVVVFAGELWKATLIKTMLEDNDIAAFLNNEYLGVVAPYTIDAGGIPDIKVVVSSEEEATALNLIAEFNDSDLEE